MRLLALLALAANVFAQSPLHPDFVLLDSDGRNVLETDEPVSPMRTCGECHDTKFIESHSYHVAAGSDEVGQPGAYPWDAGPGLANRWDPMLYGRAPIPGPRHPGGLRAQAAGAEMNCFLCHLRDPDNRSRIDAAPKWAATATLSNTGLVELADNGGWRYRKDLFWADGVVSQDRIGISDPRSVNCGACHEGVGSGREPFALVRGAGPTGQVYSAQSISDSALNLKGKEGLDRPWDIHAARLLECTACHHSLNNPVRFSEAERSRPDHLRYDARRLEIGDFLERPSHDFTKGESAQGHTARRLDGSMRRCEGCHASVETHEGWLPNTRRHMQTLLCESCHIPEIPAPARRQIDWTVLLGAGRPRIEYRGGDPTDPAVLLSGYEPVVLPRHQLDGKVRHGPHNLITTWLWVAGDPPRPVALDKLEAAWFVGAGSYHPDLKDVLDENGDGRIEHDELRLDTEAKVAAVTKRLEQVDVSGATIFGSIQPASLHHAVVGGQYATRRCETCHSADSRLTRSFELSSYVPAGATPELVNDTNIEMPGRLHTDESGRLLYTPVPTASGRYVIGHDRAGWIDVVGLLAVIGTLIGAGGHGLLRLLSARRASS